MIIMTTIMKGSHYNLDLISYLIGDKIPSVNEFHPGIHLAKGIESHFVPVGRGSKISSKNWIYPSSMLNGPCTNVLRDLGVDIDGNVMPCCSALARLKNLKLGNLKRRNLSEILEMAYKKQYFKTLSSLGPTQLAERGFANKYTSKCHLCYDVLKKF